jgi:Fe-S oxidoreductase
VPLGTLLLRSGGLVLPRLAGGDADNGDRQVGSEKPAQNRIREAEAIPQLEVYVVSCPKDLTMFEDALKTTGNEGKFVVRELIELAREAVTAEAAAVA